MDSATICAENRGQPHHLRSGTGLADFIWTSDDCGEFPLLLVLPFHHCFDYTRMVTPQVDEDMTDACLCLVS